MQAVLPIERKGILEDAKIEGYPALNAWWTRANQVWEANRSSERLTLSQQLDYHGKLRGQLPVGAERVAYTKSGMHLAAARVSDPRAIIDHTLYWAAVATAEEGRYLCAILNAVVVTERVRPLMAYGKDERHIDKYVWSLPIPMFDPANALHQRIAVLGRDAEEFVAQVGIGTQHFARQRRLVRDLLAESDVGRAIELAVTQLLDAPGSSQAALADPTEANITALLEAGRTAEARALAAGTRWEAALAPPLTKAAETASATGDLPANLHWVAENATAYRAKWVALKAGSLVASGSSLATLQQELRGRVDRAELTLMQVPA